MAEVHGEVGSRRRAPEILLGKVPAERNVAREAMLLDEPLERVVLSHRAADEEKGRRPAGSDASASRIFPTRFAGVTTPSVAATGRSRGRPSARRASSRGVRGASTTWCGISTTRAFGLSREHGPADERRMRDDGLGRADDAPRTSGTPTGRGPTRAARSAPAPPPRTPGLGRRGRLEGAGVVRLAAAVEVRRGEQVVKDEVVEDDDGGRRPPGRRERLDGRRVQRVVPDLEEEDVVPAPKASAARAGS